MKDRHGSSPPLPICLGYCTTDAHVFFTYFLLLCLSCGKMNYYLSKRQMRETERYTPLTHGANDIVGVIFPVVVQVFDVYTVLLGGKKSRFPRMINIPGIFNFVNICHKWEQMGGIRSKMKIKEQQKAPCFGC